MVMPNIGVFIGWGVLTALFIDTGWCPNAYWNELVNPILKYLMPTLIGYTAGSNVYGRRGGVIGAFATMGVVIGSDVTMLVGGMIMGPLAAWCLKKFDKLVEGKIKTGLEMLVDNFSLGLIGMVLCMLGYATVAPIMTAIQNVLGAGVEILMNHGLLPFVSLFVQPAQVLFLNNAINHGIMIPLAVEQAAEFGKSVLFLVEANGANWVGLTLAFAVFGSGMEKKSAPGAALIMFLGGIAEVCFPYCLMSPLTILGPIAGNIFSLFILTAFGGGTVGAVSPGSVIAYFMMTPKSSMVANAIAYFGSLAISFLVTGLILKAFGTKSSKEKSTKESDGKSAGSLKASSQNVLPGKIDHLEKVVFACDAGMGSSAMGVSILKDTLAKAGMNPKISHVAVAEIPEDADVVVTNENLAERAHMSTQGKIPILTLSNFMDQGEYDRIVSEIHQMTLNTTPASAVESGGDEKPVEKVSSQEKPLLPEENILLDVSFPNKKAAIERCADLLIDGGYTLPTYKQDMLTRDEEASVYIGNGVALPHGLASSKETILNSGICFVQVPKGVDFDGETAYLLIGVAGRGEEHIELLGQIARNLMENDNIEKLRNAKNKEEVKEILNLTI